MRLVRLFIGRKARVAINAKQRSTRASGIGHQVRRNFIQRRSKVGDELDRRLARAALVLFFASLKPFAIIVALEASQKTEEFGSEMRGHVIYGKVRRHEK